MNRHAALLVSASWLIPAAAAAQPFPDVPVNSLYLAIPGQTFKGFGNGFTDSNGIWSSVGSYTLPPAGTLALGGVFSAACGTHNVVAAITTAGSLSCEQLAVADIYDLPATLALKAPLVAPAFTGGASVAGGLTIDTLTAGDISAGTFESVYYPASTTIPNAMDALAAQNSATATLVLGALQSTGGSIATLEIENLGQGGPTQFAWAQTGGTIQNGVFAEPINCTISQSVETCGLNGSGNGTYAATTNLTGAGVANNDITCWSNFGNLQDCATTPLTMGSLTVSGSFAYTALANSGTMPGPVMINNAGTGKIFSNAPGQGLSMGSVGNSSVYLQCITSASGTLGCASPGTGLLDTGGVFSVSYGTTSGTAAQGNDSRITGAVQTSSLPSSAPFLLTSGTTIGAGSAGQLRFQGGQYSNYMDLSGEPGTSNCTLTAVAGTTYDIPIFVDYKSAVLHNFGFSVSTLGSASVVDVGIRAYTPTAASPGGTLANSLLYDSGNVTLVANSNQIPSSGSIGVTLTQGIYFMEIAVVTPTASPSVVIGPWSKAPSNGTTVTSLYLQSRATNFLGGSSAGFLAAGNIMFLSSNTNTGTSLTTTAPGTLTLESNTCAPEPAENFTTGFVQ